MSKTNNSLYDKCAGCGKVCYHRTGLCMVCRGARNASAKKKVKK